LLPIYTYSNCVKFDYKDTF